MQTDQKESGKNRVHRPSKIALLPFVFVLTVAFSARSQENNDSSTAKPDWISQYAKPVCVDENGVNRRVHANGSLAVVGRCDGGLPHGTWKWFYPSGGKYGSPYARGAFDHGRPVGVWTLWRENGTKSHESDFSSDNPLDWIPVYCSERGDKFVYPMKLFDLSALSGFRLELSEIAESFGKLPYYATVGVAIKAVRQTADETKEIIQDPVGKAKEGAKGVKKSVKWLGETAEIIFRDLWPF